MSRRRFRIRKGLTLPLAGAPAQQIEAAQAATHVALLGGDYPGLKPRMAVETGQRVRVGDTLFTDKRDPAVGYASPGTGVVRSIERGGRRALRAVIVELDGDEAPTFEACDPSRLAELEPGRIAATLQASGLWTALRERPFNRVARSDARPASTFVTAIDTQPLAPDPTVVITDAGDAFRHGLTVLAQLTGRPVNVCVADGVGVSLPDIDAVREIHFAGPHPAGLVGTHIHFVDPVGAERLVWHIGYQDVIAIGRLFVRGELPLERVISLGGPQARRPRLLRTRLGAGTDALVDGELHPGRARVISGSVLDGRHAAGWGRFLGRYHQGIAVLPEPGEREFLGWLVPGLRKFSANRVYLSHLFGARSLPLNTSQQGSPRAIVPVGHYEKVLPLDLLATPLLKALIVRDVDTAQSLGALELAEEDVALCSLVCCSKQDFGAALRASLDILERQLQ